MYKTIDFLSFQKLFSTEQQCWHFLFKQRWPQGYICPKCGCLDYSFIKSRRLCQCKSCRYQCSVTAGTIFHKTKTPLKKLFWLVYFIAHDKIGHSALDLTRKLDISYKVAWSMGQKIRAAMIERDANYKLTGLLELDDAYFGAKNVAGHRGRGADKKSPVIVAAQLNDNKRPIYASMIVIDDLRANSIKQTTTEHIEKGSTLKTDGYSSFNILNKGGYEHLPEVIGDPKNAAKVLPWVHIFIANAKSMIRGTYKGVSSKYLQRYLSEFCYRLNRRFNVDIIFARLLTACIENEPVTIKQLRE